MPIIQVKEVFIIKKLITGILILLCLAGCRISEVENLEQPSTPEQVMSEARSNSTSRNATQRVVGTIDSIDDEYIYIATEDSNVWAIGLVDGYQVGQRVSITYDDMGTDDIYDDQIVNVVKE